MSTPEGRLLLQQFREYDVEGFGTVPVEALSKVLKYLSSVPALSTAFLELLKREKLIQGGLVNYEAMLKLLFATLDDLQIFPREQLEDPAFVMAMTDADRDGTLDFEEKHHALQALGFDCPDLLKSEQTLSALAAPVDSVVAFKKLIGDVEKAVGLSQVKTCRASIPHACRGISLGQLMQVQQIFLDDGWLLNICNHDNDVELPENLEFVRKTLLNLPRAEQDVESEERIIKKSIPASIAMSGWTDYNGRFNGEFRPDSREFSGKPLFMHVGHGMEWCRMWWHDGCWIIGHVSWLSGDSSRAVAFVCSDADHPMKITGGWQEHKGRASGLDFAPTHQLSAFAAKEGISVEVRDDAPKFQLVSETVTMLEDSWAKLLEGTWVPTYPDKWTDTKGLHGRNEEVWDSTGSCTFSTPHLHGTAKLTGAAWRENGGITWRLSFKDAQGVHLINGTTSIFSNGIRRNQIGNKVEYYMLEDGRWCWQSVFPSLEEGLQEDVTRALDGVLGAGLWWVLENLYTMNTHIIQPITKPGGNPARQQDRYHQIPEAVFETSYSELVNPLGRYVHYFVSHFWGHPFRKTVSALKLWAESRQADIGLEHATQCIYWICLFAINQHKAAEEVGSSPATGPFNAALALAQYGAVMVVGHRLEPFHRIWCVFEVYQLTQRRTALELVSDLGPLTNLARSQSRHDNPSVKSLLHEVGKGLQEVHAKDAAASKMEDKLKIFHAIADNTMRQLSFPVFCQTRKYEKDPSSFLQFDSTIQGMLATPMMNGDYAVGEAASVLKWCMAGARFGDKEIEMLEQAGMNPLTYQEPLRGSLLVVAASTGNTEGVAALLARRADLEAKGGFNTWMKGSALFWASHMGFLAIAQSLLEHMADPNTFVDQWLATPLVVAARANQYDVLKLLLDHGADFEERSVSGTQTALHEAAAFASCESIKLLLEVKADVFRRSRGTKCVPLEVAVSMPNPKVLELLAAAGALRRQNVTDRFPLQMVMELQNDKDMQLDVTKKFIELRADLEERDSDGRTALMMAVEQNFTHLISVLLEAGADIHAVTQATHMSKLKLVPRGSAQQCFFDELLQPQWEGEMPLRLQTPAKWFIVHEKDEPGHAGPWSWFFLAIGPASHAVHFRREGQRIVSIADGREFHVPRLDFRPGADIMAVMGPVHTIQPPSKRDFLVNDDGTISPQANPDLVLGGAFPALKLSTALHVAINYLHLEAAKQLLAAAADVNVEDEGGRSPWALASENGLTELLELMSPKLPAP